MRGIFITEAVPLDLLSRPASEFAGAQRVSPSCGDFEEI
ncbi:hypothetical protein D554_1605 [Bordetella holmesii 30539]|uniref:Uncharacterized protein n=2 Tax=Bordetella holmesii TaxID=35814 RepID=A0A158M870_9BORD|nr:hypothetical protein D560_2155 [Bordetella holmesii ATCC 51541]AIT26795.1 hypothetical protein D558_2133 [Bordetella holmesii 44057]AMD50558.1 hypothetical protein F783_008375 [Bordetella holmesii F627]EWM43325.1 hypothetical protein D556_2147 [Bordetella holmesii 41130]EWM47382.1 hypothetical protein D555_2173 [Bordetella holmesii 35009]EWM51542.1 hypothetical protein D557_1403 [Bordetella holmesii 70147]EXF88786.1 hypothetical protein D554_1605 [Bordetella holmesii 30539]EXX92869.1 hypo